MKTVACIIARTNSTRLKKKVLKEINGVKLIEYLIRKVKNVKNIDEVYLCTSEDENDQVLLEIAEQEGIKSYAGSRDAVIERMLNVAEISNADNVVRITGDNIFTDEDYLDLMINHHNSNDADYTRTEYLPVGVTSEVIKVKALKECYNSIDPNYSQYLLLYMFSPRDYKCQVLIPPKEEQRPNWTLTVDTKEDWERTLEIIGTNNELLNYRCILDICEKNKISNLIYLPSGEVKFPAGVCLSYAAFREEMESRINLSHKILLK